MENLEQMIDALSRCEDCVLDLSEATEQEIQKEYHALKKLGLLEGEPPANLRRTSGEPPANLRRTSGEPPANLRREDVEHLKPEELVEMLKTNGSRTISIVALKRHIASGAPVNDDGTIDVVSYAAWLAKFVE